MNMLIILPLLIPLLTAILALLLRSSVRAQRLISVSGALLLLVVSIALLIDIERQGPQALQVGSWPAPYGITLVADLFSAIMVLLTGILGTAVAVYSLGSIDGQREKFGFHPLYHFLLVGVCGAFLTGDLFNLYVWFEVMLMSSFVLMALGGERGQMEGAIKYVTINLVSSAMFLSALGLLYALAGTLNMADLAQKFSAISASTSSGILMALAMLFLVAFGIKAAIFPFFFWLPASYHTPPVAVTALFSGLLTKVGVYALIRVFTLIFVQDVDYTRSLFTILAGFTMVIGVLGAVAQYDFRRLLSFHIISQIGYILLGLGIYSSLALGSAVFFIFHVSLAKTALFLVSGVTHHLRGTYELKKLGGLYQARPVLAVLFLVPAMSLAGLPPLSGFLAKLGLVQAGLGSGQYAIILVALGVSLLTLFSMLKIWNEAFWKPAPDAAAHQAELAFVNVTTWLVPILVLGAMSVLLGIWGGTAFGLAQEAGRQLLDPSAYIQAVMGAGTR